MLFNFSKIWDDNGQRHENVIVYANSKQKALDLLSNHFVDDFGKLEYEEPEILSPNIIIKNNSITYYMKNKDK